MQQEHSWDKFWQAAKRGLLTASVVFNILVFSYVGGAFARRLGLIEGKKPIAAKERTAPSPGSVAWPKRMGATSLLSFEEVKRKAEEQPKAKSFILQAQKNGYPFGWNFSLHYRPADSAFFYLAELAAERCDCEGNPFRKTGLRLFLNPYEGRVFFVDTLKDVPPSLAVKD